MDREKQIENVNSWLTDISKAAGTDLQLDSEGTCTFKIEDNILAIEVSYDYPMVHLYSPLVPLPIDDREMLIALITRALELNSFQALTRGGALATPPGGGFLIYCYSVPIQEMNAEKFSSILGAFYETLPELKKMLSEFAIVNKSLSQPGYLNFGRKV